MAENHPVGFQWVMEARRRGAKLIHADPRFTRTSAVADLHVPLRAGSDIAFLGGLINFVLEGERDFREYVLAYTNAPVILSEDFRDTEDLGGVFSGWDPETGSYDPSSWQYEGVSVAGVAGAREQGAPYGTQSHGAHGASFHPGRSRRRTRRCSTRAASTRCSGATSRGTRRSSSSRRAGSRATSSSRWPRSCAATPARSAPRRSSTPSAGPSTRSACSTSAPPRSSSSCSGTS